MKKNYRFLLVGFIIFSLGSFFVMKGQAEEVLSLKEMDYLGKMELLNNQLKADLAIGESEKSGDLNAEFFKHINIHQKLMIALIQNELKYGADEEMKELAKELLEEAKRNVEFSDEFLKSLDGNLVIDKEKEGNYLVRYGEVYTYLLDGMKPEAEARALIVNKGVDRDFLGRVILQCEVFDRMLIAVWPLTDSKDVLEFLDEASNVNATYLQKFYELIAPTEKKEDKSGDLSSS